MFKHLARLRAGLAKKAWGELGEHVRDRAPLKQACCSSEHLGLVALGVHLEQPQVLVHSIIKADDWYRYT